MSSAAWIAKPQQVSVLALSVLAVGLFARSGSGAPQQRDQPLSPSAGSASIAGRVLIVVNGQPAPVRRARVSADSSALPQAEVVDSDIDGRFRFDHLPAGTYRIAAEKPGFVMPDRRSTGAIGPVEVKAGQSLSVDLTMLRGAALEGQLLTDNGDPAINIVVSAVRLAYGPYGKRPVAIRQARTDDRGHFRVHTLPAGEYYLDAATDPIQILSTAQVPGQRSPGLARSYYPGTARLDEARIIPLSAGQETSALDFRMTTVPMASVTGRVLASSGKAPVSFGIRIQRVGAPTGEVRGLSLPQSNTFQFPIVPPGEYWLTASALPAAGADLEFTASRITVAGRDLLNLTMTTAKGAVVNGRIEVEGTPLPPWINGLQVVAHETEFELPGVLPSPPPPAATPGTVRADGTVTFPSLFGTRLFRPNRLPEGWAVKGIWLDDVEVGDTPVDFKSTDRPQILRIVLTNRTAIVSGAVERGPSGANARVVVFADDVRRRGLQSRFTRSVEAGPDGRYTVRGLLPGKYYVAAVEHLDEGSWDDPDLLARLQSIGSAIVVSENQKMTVALKLGAVR